MKTYQFVFFTCCGCSSNLLTISRSMNSADVMAIHSRPWTPDTTKIPLFLGFPFDTFNIYNQISNRYMNLTLLIKVTVPTYLPFIIIFVYETGDRWADAKCIPPPMGVLDATPEESCVRRWPYTYAVFSKICWLYRSGNAGGSLYRHNLVYTDY